MVLDTKYIKSYLTEENLKKALAKAKIDDHRHLVVWTKDGRCTALFAGSNFERHGISYLGFYSHYGFAVFG
jgi:hypothetical protein